MPKWLIALKSRHKWLSLPAHLIHFCFAWWTLVAQFPALESFLLLSFPPKQVFQLTVPVNRQLFVLTTSQLGCAINRKDKKVKQEELCWSQRCTELRNAQSCLLFTGKLDVEKVGELLCSVYTYVLLLYRYCGLVFDRRFTITVSEFQPLEGDNLDILILSFTNNEMIQKHMYVISHGYENLLGAPVLFLAVL